ncbi:diphosphoinositol polyphosphate phosphohydrolase 1 isoform X2 [Gorilla gorilla gorilla]|uniref:diphosphoinositol polyphosphate phosphohydrolase 1 isoform X2 n=1 Tax=Gorilla gorilla gorilla TaxID=9595 RepID=UPI002445D7F8|nr:diphosphoinositol polyphosphate phosphohydrolase 1 isoform X2 [Gorilla gorilla gorilla]
MPMAEFQEEKWKLQGLLRPRLGPGKPFFYIPLAEARHKAGVKGTLGRLVGIFENQERKHRTYVYVLIVTEVLEDWEDSVNIGRKREWFKIEDAIKVLQYHKPVQASYFETLRQGYSANNGTPVVATTYSVSAQSSMSGIR